MKDKRNDAAEEAWFRVMDTPSPPRKALPVSPGRRIRSCPMNSDWRNWYSGTPERFRLADPAARRKAAAAQRAPRGRLVRKVLARWERAADDAVYQPERDPQSSVKSGSPSHVHTSFRLGKQRIHIDRMMIERSGPLCMFIEYRIYVDGAVAGRGGICAGPYGNGNHDLPAVAFLNARRILSVDRNLDIRVWESPVTPSGHPAA